ncbi:MAG: phosphatidylserine decarboxylase [Candidatus Aenigmarchaeota archaeon ex4484_52]|nr:MAG: phosphatidylserine decarboxylase [Candidatus Aenigmarchaeota archaeon ex4484_52]
MKIKTIKTLYIKRNTKKICCEEEINDPLLCFFFGKYGSLIRNHIFDYPVFSKILAHYYKSKFSKKAILKFIEKYNIDANEFEKNIEEFKSFNEFFIRKLKPCARKIEKNKISAICPADSMALAFENIDTNKIFQIKHETFKLDELLKGFARAQDFECGNYCIFRLTPKHYHRFHFIDDGKIIKTKSLKGKLYSVNLVSLKQTKKLYIKNKKYLTLFESKNFGNIICIEIGAVCIGSIVQTYKSKNVLKGDEKGYFQYGGSAILIFFQKNKIKIDNELLENTKNGYETEVKIGEFLGEKIIKTCR